MVNCGEIGVRYDAYDQRITASMPAQVLVVIPPLGLQLPKMQQYQY
jgi:hypothetical protein